MIQVTIRLFNGENEITLWRACLETDSQFSEQNKRFVYWKSRAKSFIICQLLTIVFLGNLSCKKVLVCFLNTYFVFCNLLETDLVIWNATFITC